MQCDKKTGPPDFLSQFFKIQKNDSIKGGTPEVLGDEKTNWDVLYSVRLGQVRIAIKSSIIQNTKAPIHSLAFFGQKFERTVFERTTSSQLNNWLIQFGQLEKWF